MKANLRDKSISLISPWFDNMILQWTCANDRLIRLKKSSRKLAFIYVIGFVINLYLMLFINI